MVLEKSQTDWFQAVWKSFFLNGHNKVIKYFILLLFYFLNWTISIVTKLQFCSVESMTWK